MRTSTILIAPVLCGRCASADSIAISRLSRYGSSCSKQMYRTLAWPPDAMLRAIWRAIVVLPVPWAPPMRSSSPARRPPPMVLSSGVNPSGTGWYSATWPADDLLVEVDEDVEGGTGRHAAVRGVEAPGRRRGGVRLRVGGFGAHVARTSPSGAVTQRVASGTPRITHPDPPDPHRAAARRAVDGRRQRGRAAQLVPGPDDRPDRRSRSCAGPSTRWARGRCRWAGVNPSRTTGSPRIVSKLAQTGMLPPSRM